MHFVRQSLSYQFWFSLVLFYNFIPTIGYFISTIGNCPFYQISLLHNLQKGGYSANFGRWLRFPHHYHCHSHHHSYHHHHQPQVLIFSALTYMSEKEIPSTSFTSVIDAFWYHDDIMTVKTDYTRQLVKMIEKLEVAHKTRKCFTRQFSSLKIWDFP